MPCSPVKQYDADAFRAAEAHCNFHESGAKLVVQGTNVKCYKLDSGYFHNGDCLCSSGKGSGKHRCDGVMLGCVDERCFVIFVDLKKGRDDRVVEQISDTICYFCRCEEEGEKHHDVWHEQAHFKGHKVVALVMNDKPPKDAMKVKCGKRIYWRGIGRKKAWSSLEELVTFIELLE